MACRASLSPSATTLKAMKIVDRISHVFVAACGVIAALFSPVALAQGMNVSMPIASSCPTGYHWEMAAGYAQCVVDVIIVLPPPTSSYPYVYEVSASFFETTQRVRVTMMVNYATGGGGWNSAAYSTTDYNGNFAFPWGGDLSWFWENSPPPSPADLYDPVQWFAAQGCRVLSADSSVQGIVDAAVASAGGSPVGGQAKPRYGQGLWVNYAACPGRVF